MRFRFPLQATMMLATVLMLLGAACSSSSSSVATQNSPGIDDELAQAIDRALADCFDPLHDSDGSGGFFEFCSRADQASAAGQLDCLRSSADLSVAPACAEWTVQRVDVPPQYFDVPAPAPAVNAATATEPPAAIAEPAPVDSATGFPADRLILAWTEFGGCGWAGDFCRSYQVFGDGRVEGSQGGAVLATGTVDAALVRAVIDAADVDTQAVIASLGPGPCRAASDGISYRLWISPADLEIDSCDVDIYGDDPLVATARELGQAAELAAPIE